MRRVRGNCHNACEPALSLFLSWICTVRAEIRQVGFRDRRRPREDRLGDRITNRRALEREYQNT